MQNQSYEEDRKKFFSKVPNFWPDLYGEEYSLYDVQTITSIEQEKIWQATERIGKIFFKMAELLRKVPDQTLIEMGFPKVTLPFLRIKALPIESVISRLDLVKVNTTYKCIEINSDTPTFIKELFYVNERICQEFKVQNPNTGMEEELRNSLNVAISQSSKWINNPYPHIVFTAHIDSIEDYNTVRYLQDLTGYPSKFVPLDKLQIIQDVGLYDENGNQIDILYRQTFPIENLISDLDEESNPIGRWLLELVEARKLAIINPPSSFLLQNKAVHVLIWGLHESNDSYFTEEEHEWIDEYFLPTYLEPDVFLANKQAFVRKPVFGREGDTIEIYNGNGHLIDEDSHKSYQEYLSIYQKYCELPVIPFQSLKGQQIGSMLIGSFLLNGKPASFGMRVGDPITNNLSYYLPVGLNEKTNAK